MRKIIFFASGIALLLFAAWGIYKITKPHHNVEGEDAVASLSAAGLYEEFEKTESLANKKWVGKVLEISGTISAVQESGNYLSVSLQADGNGGVNCSILKKDMNPDKKLFKGNPVTIKGKCTGFLMDVNMVDCIVMK
jgi:hypothetical protein